MTMQRTMKLYRLPEVGVGARAHAVVTVELQGFTPPSSLPSFSPITFAAAGSKVDESAPND